MRSRRYSGGWLTVGTVVAVVATACGGPGVPPPAIPGAPAPTGPVSLDPDRLERRIAPFPVLRADGSPFPQPFLGGFNVPRPQLVDIDADGDDDLFVQEVTGSVMFFERVDDQETPFLWRTDRYHDLEVGEWYRFVDLDQDGDLDLIAEEPFSMVRYYRNVGGPSSPSFELAAEGLEDAAGSLIFSDRQNIPNATDIDCDGLMDLFIGKVEGTVTRYEESGRSQNGVPRFVHVTDHFEDIEIVAQIGGTMHGANTMAWGDDDEDGDADLFWGDFFEPGILRIENTGTCQSPNLRTEPASFPGEEPLKTSGYNAPTVGDVDGDGDVDLLVGVLGGAFNPATTSADNFHYVEQVSVGHFERRTSRFISSIDVGSESVPVLVDLDGDGDLDLLLGNKIEQDDPLHGTLYRFLNEGGEGAPRFRLSGELALGGGYHLVPAFGDLDGDGDLDALVGNWTDQIRFYRNDSTDGSLSLSLADSAFVTLTRGSNATPALGDVDGDGDLDLFVGESSGALNFYENTGSAYEPRFTLVSDEFGDFDPGRRSLPVLVDIDGDRDLDLVVGSESEGILLFRNDGSADSPSFVEAGRLGIEDFGFAAPAFADLDADGDLDLLLGGTRGGLWFYESGSR